LSAPGVVIQNQADAGGFISNSGVLWRDGALSLGDIARPNGGAGGLRVASTAASSSPTTGALTVAGGVGVSGALVANGVVQGGQLNLTSGPVTAFSGNYHVFYGPGSRDGLFIGDTANTANLNIYRADSHAFQDRAGAATKGAVYVGCATASSSPTTGALTVAGGVGVQGGLNAGMPSSFTNPTDNKAIVFTHDAGFTYIQSLNAAQNASANMSITGLYSCNMAQLRLMADQVYMGGTTASTSTATGALTVAGGVGVAGNINASSLIASGGNFWAQVTPTTGTYHFGTSGLKYLSYDGTSFTLTGGNLQTTGSVVATGALDTTYNTDASVVTATVAAASLITIVTNFSGVIMTTCHQTGITELFLCGAGQVARLGGSGGALTSVTVNAAPPQLGYSLTNTTGATGTFSVIKLRTRSTY
jgi:hypothetical protein